MVFKKKGNVDFNYIVLGNCHLYKQYIIFILFELSTIHQDTIFFIKVHVNLYLNQKLYSQNDFSFGARGMFDNFLVRLLNFLQRVFPSDHGTQPSILLTGRHERTHLRKFFLSNLKPDQHEERNWKFN